MAITGLTAAVAPGGVQSAIARASAKTGVDFNYLLGQAQVESSLRADARAATSSATGLYQFVDQSWLAVMKRHGDEHGLGWAADAISQGANGRYHVADGETRRAILNLRTKSEVASLMAAEHAADNKEALEGALGRNVGGTDLYMAHFLGLGGARKFLATLASDPDRSGAATFPAAAPPAPTARSSTRRTGRPARSTRFTTASPTASNAAPSLPVAARSCRQLPVARRPPPR